MGTVWGLLLGLSACSLANEVDVCERRPSSEGDVNRSTDGNQSIRSPRGVAALPTGRALVTFVSAVGDDRQEVRGALVDVDGARVNTCGTPEEVTYSVFRQGGPEQLASFPVYGAPDGADGDGLLVWAYAEGDTAAPTTAELDLQLEGRFVGADGCIRFEDQQPPFVFDDPPVGVVIGPPGVARVGAERFVVAWARGSTGVGRRDGGIVAQVLRPGPFGRPAFEEVRDPSSGEPLDGERPVALIPGNGSGVDIVPLPEGRFAMLARLLDQEVQEIVFAIYEDTLDPVVPPRVIDRYGVAVESLGPVLAFDGERILGVWARNDPAQRDVERMVAVLLDQEGELLPTPHVESGEPFFLTEASDRVQLDPSVAPLPEGRGFLIAWSDSNDDESPDAIRALVLDPEGEVAFANPACDRRDFTIHGPLEDNQETPSVAAFPGGTILIGWTDRGQNGRDASGSSVRLQRTDLFRLLPIEED